MKKFIYAIAAVLMIMTVSQPVSAQTILDTAYPAKIIGVGVRASFNTSTLNTNFDDIIPEYAWNHTQWGQGFSAGLAVDINIRNFFAISSGINLRARNNTFRYLLIDNEGLEAVEGHWGGNYLEIPLLASLRLGVPELAQCHIDLGPYFATGFGGKVKHTIYSAEESPMMTYGLLTSYGKGDYFGDKGMVNRYDWGIRMGIGFLVLQHYYIGTHYNAGCHNVLKSVKDATGRARGHNKSWTFTLGYNF